MNRIILASVSVNPILRDMFLRKSITKPLYYLYREDGYNIIAAVKIFISKLSKRNQRNLTVDDSS